MPRADSEPYRHQVIEILKDREDLPGQGREGELLPLPVKSQISSEPSWEELLVLSADRLAPLVILTLRLAPAKARVSMPPPPLLPLPVVSWFTRYTGLPDTLV